MRPNFFVSTGIWTTSPGFARLDSLCADSRSSSAVGSQTSSTTVLLITSSMRFLSSSSTTSTFSPYSGLSFLKAASIACWIFSNIYSRGMPFSFSMSSIAAKNSAFILKRSSVSYRHVQADLGHLRL